MWDVDVVPEGVDDEDAVVLCVVAWVLVGDDDIDRDVDMEGVLRHVGVSDVVMDCVQLYVDDTEKVWVRDGVADGDADGDGERDTDAVVLPVGVAVRVVGRVSENVDDAEKVWVRDGVADGDADGDGERDADAVVLPVGVAVRVGGRVSEPVTTMVRLHVPSISGNATSSLGRTSLYQTACRDPVSSPAQSVHSKVLFGKCLAHLGCWAGIDASNPPSLAGGNATCTRAR